MTPDIDDMMHHTGHERAVFYSSRCCDQKKPVYGVPTVTVVAPRLLTRSLEVVYLPIMIVEGREARDLKPRTPSESSILYMCTIQN